MKANLSVSWSVIDLVELIEFSLRETPDLLVPQKLKIIVFSENLLLIHSVWNTSESAERLVTSSLPFSSSKSKPGSLKTS